MKKLELELSTLTDVIFVGINPSGKAFKKNCSLWRLHNWAEDMGMKYYSFSNVIPVEGEYKMKDIDPNFIKSFCDGYSKVIALGGFVSKVLDKCGIEHYQMPHPSPLNRLLNDKEFEKNCVKECKEWLET